MIQEKKIQLDAANKVLGRLATEISILLRGKNRVDFAPNKNFPIIVEVINADKIVLTGKKAETKEYKHFSGYPGGLKIRPYKSIGPKKALFLAVKRMLPKNRLRKDMIKRLKII